MKPRTFSLRETAVIRVKLISTCGARAIFITDGCDAPWSRIAYEEVPFQEIHAQIKNLQPNSLLCDLNASQYPSDGLYYSDVKATLSRWGSPSANGITTRRAASGARPKSHFHA